jgi:hypothetical protein
MPLDELEQDVGALTGKSAELQSRLKQREGGVSGLADKALESVFTIETDSSLGAGFAAWEEAGVIYVITANHVDDARSAFVTISRKGLVERPDRGRGQEERPRAHPCLRAPARCRTALAAAATGDPVAGRGARPRRARGYFMDPAPPSPRSRSSRSPPRQALTVCLRVQRPSHGRT